MARGGVLIDMGYHILDMILPFLEDQRERSEFFILLMTEMKDGNLKDSASLLLTHQNDQIQGTITLNQTPLPKKRKNL